ncbi:hypothetical protein J6590_096546 [Homalodisca vitripennis]|nr:hypothetical protein J6590_096546 [Homalodisca vitripennis]
MRLNYGSEIKTDTETSKVYVQIPLHLDCTTFCSLVVSDVETLREVRLSVFVLRHRLFLDLFRQT